MLQIKMTQLPCHFINQRQKNGTGLFAGLESKVIEKVSTLKAEKSTSCDTDTMVRGQNNSIIDLCLSLLLLLLYD